MDAAIQKILSDNIDLDDKDVENVGDFREVSSESEGEGEEEKSDIPSSDEEDVEEVEEEEDEDEDEDDDDDLKDLDPDDDSDFSDKDGTDNEHEEQHLEIKGFLDGVKADTFARAFSRIIDSSSKSIPETNDAPILAASKSIAKKRAEEEETTKADRQAKKQRLEMKHRGHVIPGKHGQNPQVDAREKMLQKTATKGVVQLFNAIAKAQKQLRQTQDATGNRAKAAKLGKASFLAELRNTRSAPEATIVPTGGGAHSQHNNNDDGDNMEEGGWNVLKDAFTGLQGSGKMKDWDRAEEEEQEMEGAGVEGEEEDEDEDGW